VAKKKAESESNAQAKNVAAISGEYEAKWRRQRHQHKRKGVASSSLAAA